MDAQRLWILVPSWGTSVKAIEANKLTRDYGELRAVDELSFVVEQGEICGFLGPNGAGKTTTLRLLTGLSRPTSGAARVAGYDVVTERQRLKPKIGVVFEHQNLYEQLSAWDNLVFSARLYGAKRTRVGEVLGQVGLTQRARGPVRRYSSGMKKRLLIARALLHQPKVLFLDEPTCGLDPNVAREIRAIVSNLSSAGVTILLATHNMYEADGLCDRLLIIDRGRLVAHGAPAQLRAEHGGTETASLEDVFVRLTGRHLD